MILSFRVVHQTVDLGVVFTIHIQLFNEHSLFHWEPFEVRRSCAMRRHVLSCHKDQCAAVSNVIWYLLAH